MRRRGWVWSFFSLCFVIVGAGIIINTVFKDKTSTIFAAISGKEVFHVPDVNKLKHDDYGQSVREGKELIDHTSERLPENVGNSLNCISCHAGGNAQVLSFVGVAKKYPSYSDREGKVIDLADRVNGCMIRSMDGKELPKNSPELKAMVNYITYLSKDVKDPKKASWLNPIAVDDLPKVTAQEGKKLYKDYCLKCHATDGSGDQALGIPALWGDDTYNDGAGMSKIPKATGFIMKAMPLDRPGTLTKRQAAAIATYIDTMERPHFEKK
ncbi:c-type cytochrome [Camelliibacillus cellulosilyticus]|uniref:c-type cytochrome n=1 Tax=Camelliibacillus cellulosilyticus TaxID=2174486 RepID=UPI00366A7CD0